MNITKETHGTISLFNYALNFVGSFLSVRSLLQLEVVSSDIHEYLDEIKVIVASWWRRIAWKRGLSWLTGGLKKDESERQYLRRLIIGTQNVFMVGGHFDDLGSEVMPFDEASVIVRSCSLKNSSLKRLSKQKSSDGSDQNVHAEDRPRLITPRIAPVLVSTGNGVLIVVGGFVLDLSKGGLWALLVWTLDPHIPAYTFIFRHLGNIISQ